MAGYDLEAAPASAWIMGSLLNAFIIMTILAAFTSTTRRLRKDYIAYLALGPGGTPSTVAGYLRVKALGLFALRDPFKAVRVPVLGGTRGYLTKLPKREGARPAIRGIAPHRQINQKASATMFAALSKATEQMAAHCESLAIGTSCFEKHGTGLFSKFPVTATCRGEIFHAHASDGSMHLTLHPADINMVLASGWGERHPLARGGWFAQFVPEGFMMIYAPRNEQELATILRVVKAARWFVSGDLDSEVSNDHSV